MQRNHRYLMLYRWEVMIYMLLTLLSACNSAIPLNYLAPGMQVSRQEVEPKPSKSIYEIVPKNYIIHEPPPTLGGKPVPVELSVRVTNIPTLDEIKEELSMELNIRFYWIDTRLDLSEFKKQFPDKPYFIVTPTLVNKLWAPDFFSNFVKGLSQPQILTLPSSLRVYQNHTLRYSVRSVMDLSCPMDVRMFPAGKQTCGTNFMSFSLTRDSLNITWRGGGDKSVVTLAHRLSHYDFDFSFLPDGGNGNYPYVRMLLNLQRRINFHVMQTYIPSLMFVIISWLSYLVPADIVGGRMSLCMTTLLSLTAMFASVRQSTPSASYIKALDIWMIACVIFVFFTLLGYTIVLNLLEKLKKFKTEAPKEPRSSGKKISVLKLSGELALPMKTTRLLNLRDLWKNPTAQGIKDFEKLVSLCIRVSFLVFNLIYWSWLLQFHFS